MNRIDKKFKELKRRKKKAFIAYITAGDPNLAMTERLVSALEYSGVDIIELGIPFSDPLADGPTIQAASQRALEEGVDLDRIFRMVGRIRKRSGVPLVFMTYYNPVLRHGLTSFAGDCARYGVDGVIIPDLPCEEARDIRKIAACKDIATIFLAAPTSTKERMRRIAKDSRGFIYYVSLTGVTGARKRLPVEIAGKVRQMRNITKTPVCVGFGISNPGQAKAIARISDGVIVGSAIVKLIEKNSKNRKNLISKVSGFVKRLAKAVHGE
ncbi:MAG: tryptophan synthase subunit alpha [Candidatus Omnitrophica bacterium]|nr:tryptophan synthase subunit alpha [Candidatus Omnitrophota bacterium]